MPSPDLLPRGRSFPSAAAPALDDVLKGARRRRTRHAGMVGVVAAAAVAAATFAFVPHGSPDSLHAVTPTLPGHTTPPSPAAHVPSVDVVRSVPRHPKSHGVVGRSQHHVATPGYQPPANGTLQQPRSSDGSDVATTARNTVGPPHRWTKFDPTKGCGGTGPAVSEGWCSYYDGSKSGVPGRTVTLATDICRLPGQGTGTLVSRNGRQADFDVGVKTFRPLWRWSRGRTFSQPKTSLRVAAGTCVEWYVSWRIVDNSGQPLKRGSYYLDATPLVWDPSVQASTSTQNPIAFTVR